MKGKTDSKTLERAIRAATGVRSRKFRIDIARIKEMVETEEVTEMRWISGKDQVEDGLIKDGGKLELLREYIEGREEKKKGGKIE